MSRESNDFSKIRYEYLKGQAFVSKEDVEGFIEAIDEKGLMSYVVFDDGDISRKGVLEFTTKNHIITLEYKRVKGLIDPLGDPVIKDRRSHIRVNVSQKIKAKNYSDKQALNELKLINISIQGLLCEKPSVILNIGECIYCLGAYYKIIRTDKDSIGMEFKYSDNEEEHKMMLSNIMWGGELEMEK